MQKKSIGGWEPCVTEEWIVALLSFCFVNFRRFIPTCPVRGERILHRSYLVRLREVCEKAMVRNHIAVLAPEFAVRFTRIIEIDTAASKSISLCSLIAHTISLCSHSLMRLPFIMWLYVIRGFCRARTRRPLAGCTDF